MAGGCAKSVRRVGFILRKATASRFARFEFSACIDEEFLNRANSGTDNLRIVGRAEATIAGEIFVTGTATWTYLLSLVILVLEWPGGAFGPVCANYRKYRNRASREEPGDQSTSNHAFNSILMLGRQGGPGTDQKAVTEFMQIHTDSCRLVRAEFYDRTFWCSSVDFCSQ